jgi:hypothetical protein
MGNDRGSGSDPDAPNWMFGARRAEFEKGQADAQRQSDLDEQIRKGNEERAATPERQLARQENERSEQALNSNVSQNRAAYVQSQRDYFNSVSEGMSAQSITDRGGVKIGSTQSIGGGAAGIIAAGGQRKGGYTSLGSGADGIVAAGGPKRGIELGINSTFRDQLNAVRWGSGMQKYRTLVRQYERKEREKKKNDGGLTAARQTHSGKEFFPHRPTFKVGGVTFSTMKFENGIPLVGTYIAAQEGWPTNDEAALNRSIRQAGRIYRSTRPTYGP